MCGKETAIKTQGGQRDEAICVVGDIALAKEEEERRGLLGANKRKRYFLGEKYPGVYFTRREAESVYYLMTEQSYKRVADKLGLSTRTVEYYVNNAKKKLDCNTRLDLLLKVLNSDFLKEVDFVK